MEIVAVEHASDLYWRALKLRQRVLRWPLGREYSDEDLAAEAGETSIVVTDGEEVVGTMQLRPLDANTLKVRQVAVAEDRQGTGVGRQMNDFAELWIRDHGFHQTELHARALVVDFYLKQGYTVVGDEFIEVGIPHRKMVKSL